MDSESVISLNKADDLRDGVCFIFQIGFVASLFRHQAKRLIALVFVLTLLLYWRSHPSAVKPEMDPLANVRIVLQDGTEDMDLRKAVIYTELKKIRDYLTRKPPRKRSFPSIHVLPNWIPSIINRIWRNLYSCATFRKEGFLKLVTFSVKDSGMNRPRMTSPTMVTQLSADRFQTLEILLSYWSGPISAAVYVDHNNLEYIAEYLKPVFYKNENLLLHFVPARGEFYPVNQLRNIALSAAQTEYVFVNDVDFVPSPELHSDLERLIVSKFYTADPKALVIPAFGLHSAQDRPPPTKEDLRDRFNKSISIFGADHYSSGHLATDYQRWFSADDIYQVQWMEGWEPYVLLKKSQTPQFNQRFLGRQKDKVSFIVSLHHRGFRFYVHPTAFITHLYHSAFADSYKTLYLRCSRKLMYYYMRSLEREKKILRKI